MDTHLNKTELKQWKSFIHKDRKTQVSPILFDAVSREPIKIYPHTEPALLINEIQAVIDTISLITTLGWAEHTGDWDPYIRIELKDGNTITTDNGYYEMQIQEQEHQNILLLEDSESQGEQWDEDISYHIIDITTIASIQLLR